MILPPVPPIQQMAPQNPPNLFTHESSQPTPITSYSPPRPYYNYEQYNYEQYNYEYRHHYHNHHVYSPHQTNERSSVPSTVIVPKCNNHNQRDNQIVEVGDNDILCGRGAPTTWHPGNKFFREIVKNYQSVYLSSRRADKPLIATRILEVVRSRGGRFLKRHKRAGVWQRGHFVWVEIEEQRAYEKICQALREGAPDIRRQMLLRTKCGDKKESGTA